MLKVILILIPLLFKPIPMMSFVSNTSDSNESIDIISTDHMYINASYMYFS